MAQIAPLRRGVLPLDVSAKIGLHITLIFAVYGVSLRGLRASFGLLYGLGSIGPAGLRGRGNCWRQAGAGPCTFSASDQT